MTDHDRGAYAPQSDAPLAFDTFDARPRGRRPMPMTLIGSAVVLAVMLTAVVMFYRSGVKGAGGPPRPVGQAVASIKTAPAAGAQPADPAANLDVYSPQNVPASPASPGPAFTAAPEKPMPRPKPKPAPATVAVAIAAPAKPTALKVETLREPAVKVEPARKLSIAVSPKARPVVAATETKLSQTTRLSQTTKVAKVTHVTPTPVVEAAGAVDAPAPSKVAVARPVAPKPAHAVKTDSANADAAEPPPAIDDSGQAAPALKVAAVASAGSAAVQIGAFSTASLADKGYQDVSAQMSGRMGGRSKRVEPLHKDGHILYRTTVGGFASHEDAAAFCAALRAKGGQCMVRG